MEGDAEAAILKSMGVCVRESRSLEQSIIHQQRIRRSEAPPLPQATTAEPPAAAPMPPSRQPSHFVKLSTAIAYAALISSLG